MNYRKQICLRSVKSSVFTILIIISIFVGCTSVTVTTANTTAPVLVGPVKKINGKGEIALVSKGKLFDIDTHTRAAYFFIGGGGGTQGEGQSKTASSNEFDGLLLMNLDTSKGHAEVDKINIGSYSLLNILIAAFHKTYAGIEGRVVEKEGTK